MKLLVSDYDGTLNPFIGNPYSNLDEIDKFRKNGNLFMLSTGRSFNSIKKYIEKYNIKYDFLSCNDGGTLFDKNNNLLYTDYMNIDDIVTIIANINHISCLLPLSKYFSYDLYGEYDIISNIKCIEIGINTPLFLEGKYAKKILTNLDHLDYSLFPRYVFLKPKGGKSRTINYVLQNNNINEVYTVGDSYNDLDMLKDFNGYKIYLGSIKLMFRGIKPITSVKSLVKKINRGII